MKSLILFFALTLSAYSQILQPCAPREYIYDGRIYAREMDADTLVLMALPPKSAVRSMYIIAEDTLWSYSSIVTIRSGGPSGSSFLVWDPEQSGLGDCYGCIAADWLFTTGTIYYTKNGTNIVAELTGAGGDVRGTLRVIVRWIELY